MRAFFFGDFRSPVHSLPVSRVRDANTYGNVGCTWLELQSCA
jgi:hypothetical protein